MSGYTKLFALHESLYVPDAPILIAAGTLLRDNQAGRVLAQYSLEIQEKEIHFTKNTWFINALPFLGGLFYSP